MNARQLALTIINEVDLKGAYANIALAHEINRQSLSEQDRRLVTELVYGTVKAGATVDWLLAQYTDRPLAKIAPVIRNILRLGIYQLFFLTKIPVSAAVNEAVKLAKKYGHPGTVKFVNAVLRNAARNPEKTSFPAADDQPIKYLALKYFHPEWLVARWVDRLGFTACEELCKANNQTPPLSLRTNTLKTDRVALLRRLAAEGVACEASSLTPEGIVCREFPALATLKSLDEGLFQVQDESSMLVAHVLRPRPGETVIDACGAPGGKSTHIAAIMQNTGRIISTDIYEHKLKLTQANAARLGINIIETQVLDAAKIHEQYAGLADRVLVDAPCSGLGVLRRKPDSRWRKSEALLAELPQLQSAILRSAASCVKPGGVLVYSTCTTEPAENEDVIQEFLAERTDFSLQPAGDYLPVPQRAELIQLWPHRDGVDGFFIARMIRTCSRN